MVNSLQLKIEELDKESNKRLQDIKIKDKNLTFAKDMEVVLSKKSIHFEGLYKQS